MIGFRRFGGMLIEMDALADTLVLALVFATLAQAWSWLGSYAGIVSFGHAIFFGIGAYAVAVSNMRGGSPWYGALGGALFAVIVAAICGLLFLHGRGYLFTALSLAAVLAAAPFVGAQHWVGPGNAFGFPLHPGFLNLQFTQKWPYLLLALMVFAVTQAVTIALRATRFGYELRALRANRVAARSVGIAARPTPLLALVASAFVTAVAGSLSAEYVRAVDPQTMFAPALALDIALIGIVAGPRWAWGAPLAALVYVLLGKLVPLHAPGLPGEIVLIAQGVLILAIARFRPEGVFVAPVRVARVAVARSGA